MSKVKPSKVVLNLTRDEFEVILEWADEYMRPNLRSSRAFSQDELRLLRKLDRIVHEETSDGSKAE